MATHMAALPYCMEKLYLSSTCSKARLLFVPHLQKTVFGCTKNHPRLCFLYVAVPSVSDSRCRRMNWFIRSMVDESGSDSSESSSNSGTRLLRAIKSFRTRFSTRIKELRKGLSVKVLFFLVGFYCATAFATVIGQTGDWDILSAGLAVVVVEGIGALMYKASFPLLDKARGLITLFNYWKAGLSLGLFLDSFKYEVDQLLESCKTPNIDVTDIFRIVW